MEDISPITLNKLVAQSGYSISRNNDSVYGQFREQLQFLEDNQMIKSEKPIDQITLTEGVDIQLLEPFFFENEFTMLEIDEFNTIVSSQKDIDKGKLLSVFLYIKSHITPHNLDDSGNLFPDAPEKPEAFWKSIEQTVDDLHISKGMVIKCIKELISLGLLKKRVTGSYQKGKSPRKNAPNIYGLNNENWKRESGWALNKLKKIFDVEAFDPPIQRHKKKAKSDIELLEDEEDKNVETDNDWNDEFNEIY